MSPSAVDEAQPARPEKLVLGSNDPSIPHKTSRTRPVHFPEWDEPSASGYVVPDFMINEVPPTPFHIIVIGAGAAGIDFLHHAIPTLPQLNVTFQVYEKNEDVGGTWFENRYPGCKCDVPSASYQFPWRPNANWTSYYSSAEEIWQYMKGIVEDEGMGRYIRCNVEVTGATWVEERSVWRIRYRGSDVQGSGKEWEEECNMLINGTGFLNAWKWPSIPGLETFQGKMFHTARYEPGYDLKGKRVAVIGSGSSGVQTVAAIYEDVSALYTWVRTPTWVTAGFGQKFAGENGANFNYSREQKDEWTQNPEKHRRYSKMIELELNQRFKFALRNSTESDESNEFAHKDMQTKLGGNLRLMSNIVPKDFNVGCRRPTPGNGYLETLVAPKTTCYTGPIGSITPTGFTTSDGTAVTVDVIICATGFDTSFRPRFPIIGLDGVPLADKWARIPLAYASIAVPQLPNYFIYSGPFSPVAQGSLLPLLTHLSKHFLQIIRKVRAERIRRLSPTERAARDFAEHAATYLRRTCWSDPCTSWFKQGTRDGTVVMWPGSRLAFFEAMRAPRFEDYEIEYESGNRWGFLGNGFTTSEFDGSDITYYLDPEYLNDHLR